MSKGRIALLTCSLVSAGAIACASLLWCVLYGWHNWVYPTLHSQKDDVKRVLAEVQIQRRQRAAEQARQFVAQLDKTISPEKLRAWALPYLTNQAPFVRIDTNLAVPPEIRSQLTMLKSTYIHVDAVSESGSRFAEVIFSPHENIGELGAIMIGLTNASPDASRIRFKWANGVYIASISD
jgi:hypothetical protein